MQQPSFEHIPGTFSKKWQEIANLISNIIDVPAALIMKTENEFMEVFTSSQTENNPYKVGDKENWHGLYCETVIKTQQKLRIPNALNDKHWNKNPDLKLGMIAYLGFPINFPDQTPFGTLCVLDNKERQFSSDHEKLLLQFKNALELDLALIFSLELKENSEQSDVIQNLIQSNEEYQAMNEEYLVANEELNKTNDELQQVKREAEESEQKFRLMYENSSMGIAMLSLDFKIMAANTAYCNMLGYAERELIGKTIEDITHAESLPENLQLQHQLKQGEIPSFQLEKKFIHKKGHTIYGLLNATVIKNPENEPLYFLGNVQDITERKKAENELQKSEEKYRRIAENVTDVVWITDLEMNPTYVSPSVERVLGIKPEDYLKQPITKTYPPATIEKFKEALANELAKEQDPEADKNRTFQLEVERYYADGTLGWDAINAAFIRDEQMNPVAIQGVSHDITERKKAEEELQEKTSFLSTLMETSPVGIVTVDKTGNITYANNRAEQILGLVKDEIVSLTYDAPLWKHTDLDGSPLPDEKQPFNIVKKSLTTVFDIQHGITWPDGTVKILSINAAPIKDSTGQFDGMIASIEDISELKQAEEALKENAKKLKHWHELLNYIIKHNRSAVAVHDRDLNYIYVSQRYIDVFNVKDPNIIGKHHYEVFPDLPQKWRDVHQKSLAGEVHSAEEDPFYRADGSVEWTRWECRPWYEADGSIGGIIIYTEVITERKQREQLLTEQKELLSAIYRNAPLIMMVVNSERRIQQINGYVTQFVNRHTEEMVGLRGGEALRCVHALDDPKGCGFGEFCQQCVIRNSVLDTLETGETHLQEEAPYFFKEEDGTTREMTFMTSTSAIKVQGERMVLVTLQDITDRKQAEKLLQESNEKIKAQNEEYESLNEELRQKNEELKKAKEKAEESDRLKTAFLQNMSHEIRTPMNAILGFSDMLNKPGLSDDKRKKFVSIIQNSSNQLLSIVNDILTISSIDTNQEKLTITEVCINSIIEELHAIFKDKAQEQNIALKTNTPLTDHQVVIYTDKTKINQIFSNLLTNALKFTHEGFIELGYHLKTGSDPAEIEFYVKDSGIGMTPEQQEKIFERFQQAHESSNNNYGGTGLGLSISKEFAEMLGGKIGVDSAPNKGSTFYFTIPYKPVNESNKEDPREAQKQSSGTILVAEDEELNFFLIKEYLNGYDVKLIHAKDGRETVDVCRENPHIDLILMDIKMPDLTGDEAAKIIKQEKPGLPIVAQSAYVQKHEIDRFSEIFDDYLSKPIKADVLTQTVSQYINLSKQ